MNRSNSASREKRHDILSILGIRLQQEKKYHLLSCKDGVRQTRRSKHSTERETKRNLMNKIVEKMYNHITISPLQSTSSIERFPQLCSIRE